MLNLPDAAVVLLSIFTCLFFLIVGFLLYVIAKELIRRKILYKRIEPSRQLIIDSRKAYSQLEGSMRSFPQTIQTRPYNHIDLYWSEKNSRSSYMSLKDLDEGSEDSRKIYLNEQIQTIPIHMRQLELQRSASNKILKSSFDDVFMHEIGDPLQEIETLQNQDHIINFDQISLSQSSISNRDEFTPGLLEFSLFYSTEKLELSIDIKQALYLQKFEGDPEEELTTFVMFCFVPEDFQWQKTLIYKNSSNPTYKQKFKFNDILYHKLREYSLVFFIMEVNSVAGVDRPFGKLVYPLVDIVRNQTKNITKELKLI